MEWLGNINRPWLQFLVLGIVFYQIQTALFPQPKTVIGPLSESRQDAIEEWWSSNLGRAPSAEQQAKMIADELDSDMLFQHALQLELHLYDSIVHDQLIRNMRFLDVDTDKSDAELFKAALAMRLHLGDQVVKRRLVDTMKQRLLVMSPPVEVTQAQINAEFEARKAQFYRPPRYSFTHIFINLERQTELGSIIETIQDQRLDSEAAKYLSSPFMSGYAFQAQTAEQLARTFGAVFVSDLTQTDPVAGQWHGPVRSAFGWHYLWISAIESGRDAQIEEVAGQLRRDLEDSAREQALQTAIANLRADYEIRY
ncbi:MAG: peptidylprolyl isomerase [Porticoccaceae bacterium]